LRVADACVVRDVPTLEYVANSPTDQDRNRDQI